MKIKLGDTVTARLFGGESVTGKIRGIEICARDSKYGRAVTKCDTSKHGNGTIDIDCGHWCYFNQIKSVNSI
jgi:hypothetical protein